MKKSQYILAIDIGTVSLKLAEFSYTTSGKMTLEKYEYIEYDQEKETEKSQIGPFKKALNLALEKNSFNSKDVYLSISGQTTFIRFVKLPPTSLEKKKVKQLVGYEARQNVPYPIDKVSWSYQLFENKSTVIDEIDVMIAAAKSSIVKKIIEVIESKKFDVKLVDVSPATCFNAARASKIGESSAMILDIGGMTSTLVFIDENNFYARNIPIAGQTITQQISRKLDISLTKAEKIKKQVGTINTNELKSKEEIEVANIIKSVLLRLYGDISRSINVYKSQQAGRSPIKLYLTGGSSIIKDMPDLFASKLKIPVEYFNPFNIIQLSEYIKKKDLANLGLATIELIGLGLRKATSCPIELSLLPEESTNKQELKAKNHYFWGASAIIIICLSLILWGVNQQKNIITNLISSSKKETLITEKRLNTMKSYLKEMDKTKQRFDIATKYLNEKNLWIDILNTIQLSLPDDTWIVELAVKKDTSVAAASSKKKSLFGKTMTVSKPNQKHKSQTWIVIKAHSLAISENKKSSSAEKFKDNLLKSKTFSGNSSNVVITDFKTDPAESNNIDTFFVKIKL